MTVSVEKNGPVTTVILDRPDVRNAVDRPTAEALAEAFRAFDGDDEARVAVLWGKHGTFCAGADLKAFSEGTSGSRTNRLDPEGDAPMGVSRLSLGKPVLGAISGHAVAGGLEVALWCDLRIVEEDAIMGVYCRRWGVPLIDGGTVRLPRIVGMGRALDLVLTGRPVDATEALAMGLVSRLIDESAFESEVEQVLIGLAAKSPIGMRLGKEAFFTMRDAAGYAETLDLLCGALGKAVQTEDAREGLTAFMEKRRPVFKGR